MFGSANVAFSGVAVLFGREGSRALGEPMAFSKFFPKEDICSAGSTEFGSLLSAEGPPFRPLALGSAAKAVGDVRSVLTVV